MKKIYLLALSLSLGFSDAVAQTTSPSPAPAANQKIVTDGPVLTFAETKFDFGKIQEGEIVKHTYKFRNTGNQPLLISEVRVTCGCTSPDWTKTSVAPGETGFVTAQFNSTGKPGQNQKVVTVVSNSVTGNTHISFIADVAPKGSGTSAVQVAPPAQPAATHAHHQPATEAAKPAKK
ncbi:hypothetical protein AAE02nite_22340 [Adhaeribacter aerolatus]|uniref:DUF1573 domain-containing protein n=1 Tax=Adhaeribacter aerolatus TaxID=670289 RepID=A0A512AY01_9BACT|nr:DUF1573 domain-containing protein [Adhaeribacter aerolatus]GEO04570.1 hypothetical protein AAE02nite_22340 [Adhaeribacter aerolatus]